MNLFEQLKQQIPENKKLCREAANKLLLPLTPEYIKANFSDLFQDMQEEIYKSFLSYENKIGSEILQRELELSKTDLFERLKAFFMSCSQSRKSRAGSAFEFIVKEMFGKLNYPFSEQVKAENARLDFVLPSADHFEKQPLDSIIVTVKRTLKERWKQIVSEANKGYGFFLVTMDKEKTKSEISEMETKKVYMVVPKKIKEEKYPGLYNVITFEEFFKKHLDPAVLRWAD
ncbi:type II restriction endonuclease [Pirellulaceae bacterium]|nr:type II restriction endonuclease [Pirellulaceae bacterium]